MAKKLKEDGEHKANPTDQDRLEVSIDPFEMASTLFDIALHFQSISEDYTHEDVQQKIAAQFSLVNPWSMNRSLLEAGKKLSLNPAPLYKATQDYVEDLGRLWQNTMSRPLQGEEEIAPVIAPDLGDKRFREEDWEKLPYFNFLQQNYLLWNRWLKDVVANIEGLSPDEARRVQFYTRQLRDALAPTNFFWMNPRSVRRTLETQGQNLIKGFENLVADLDAGQGQLNIEMVKKDAFKVGDNIATTKGQVIFQNDLIQLIHYHPTKPQNFEIPLVIVPPCINKYYIFDLRPENSFVQWALDQGHAVFMISWVNPDHNLAHKTFEDYVCQGVGEAVRVAKEICGTSKVNALGFCIGGNFLVTLTGYLTAINQAESLNTTTYLATLFDFEDAGDLRVFIDERQLNSLEKQIKDQGYLDGRTLARTFNMLRANDLVWSFIINNYYLGESPMAFDMLYWNSDSTNLPAAMYTYYLRQFFLDNKLIQKGGVTIKGKPIDLSQIEVPSFVLNTREDHIAPWKCGYAGAKTFKGPTQFVLGGSGHVAGIFNPPSAQKYGYATNQVLTQEGDQWLMEATEKEGSWWIPWQAWITPQSGKMVAAIKPGQHSTYPPLEKAPGCFAIKEPPNLSDNQTTQKTTAQKPQKKNTKKKP